MKHLLFLTLPFLLAACGKPNEEKTVSTKVPLTEEGFPIDTNMTVTEITGIARIEPQGKIIAINAETSGFIRTILFSENKKVNVGDILVSLDDDLEQARFNQAQSRLKTQPTAIEAAQATLNSLQVRLAQARNAYQRNAKLLQGNAATPQETDDSRFAVEDLEKQILGQRAIVHQQKARLDELQAEMEVNRVELHKKKLRAPVGGVFLSCEVRPGNYVTTASKLGDFALDGPYLAITEIDELYAAKVKEGQQAIIRLQGSDETVGRGKVVFTGPYLKKKSLFSDTSDNFEDRRVREVHIQLDDNSKVLIGSRVECVISLGAQ
ncbi:MAG: efflux RND transporter periplasmic adaptor subunit [Haliscomenobacter sp.]|nr:efflux RND transporter periplasmic adaptor subunit [Haliscomenobacter sp.]